MQNQDQKAKQKQSVNVFNNFDNRSIKAFNGTQTFSYKRLIKHILHNAGLKTKHVLDNPVHCLAHNAELSNKFKQREKQAA